METVLDQAGRAREAKARLASLVTGWLRRAWRWGVQPGGSGIVFDNPGVMHKHALANGRQIFQFRRSQNCQLYSTELYIEITTTGRCPGSVNFNL
jgi:hypothetical protein